MRKRQGFTLVELLVVIGIIAVLISVLLPALSAAKRQANTVKCATALREIGNAFQMYSMENRGYAPVAKTNSSYRISTPTRPPTDYTGVQYWPSFLAKYVARAKMGFSTTKKDEQVTAQQSIFWGCPAFAGLISTASTDTAGFAVVQTGYGMNGFPEYTATYPPVAPPPNDLTDSAVVSSADNWRTISVGKWYKSKAWTKPSERALVSDARFWLLEAQAVPLNGQIPGQGLNGQNGFTYSGNANDGQALYDFYRHGKYPPMAETLTATGDGRYSANGGKVAYNVLFADGHVTTLNLLDQGYRSVRMRFPG